MYQHTRDPRGVVTLPPVGYNILRIDRRYFPVQLHLCDIAHPVTIAFNSANGGFVAFAKRISALVPL